ncbi:hypothetical protein MC885_014271 [Smutsia gigantea]|nr:hypothetical protein MC885_014271 [Smutsia gigantea]
MCVALLNLRGLQAETQCLSVEQSTQSEFLMEQGDAFLSSCVLGLWSQDCRGLAGPAQSLWGLCFLSPGRATALGGSGWLVPGGVGSACALLSIGAINQCLSWHPLEVSGPPCIFTQVQLGTDVTQRPGGSRSWVPRPGASRVTSGTPSLWTPERMAREAGCSHCPPGGRPADSFLQPPGGTPMTAERFRGGRTGQASRLFSKQKRWA